MIAAFYHGSLHSAELSPEKLVSINVKWHTFPQNIQKSILTEHDFLMYTTDIIVLLIAQI